MYLQIRVYTYLFIFLDDQNVINRSIDLEIYCYLLVNISNRSADIDDLLSDSG